MDRQGQSRNDRNLEHLWEKLPGAARETICKHHGFADYKTYASYRWHQFQPHTRAALAAPVQVEADAATGVGRK